MSEPTLVPVVGVGASAGGLEALRAFFASTPSSAPCAFVVVQHLSPDYKSMMAELLERSTTLQISRAEDGLVIEPGRVYINAARTDVTVSDGRLAVREHGGSGLHLPIDALFESLALHMGNRAVGVVLSGTGSDGTRGGRAIKAAGGLVLVQDPEEAQFDGMPRSVSAAGVSATVLPAAQLAEAALRFLEQTPEGRGDETAAGAAPPAALVSRVLALMHEAGVGDFSQYKFASVARRIARRLALHPGLQWEDYLEVLRSSPEELRALGSDLLIGVTAFFRDEEAFALLGDTVLPALLDESPPDRELRIWVSACSTGEEAYSIAMLMTEAMQARDDHRPFRIYATDIDTEALATASAGVYAESALADVRADRLARFFVPDEGGRFRVQRALRERVIFARHNLLRDPPMTRMDLVACRNVLIYLQADAQRRVLGLLTYALRPQGVLFLGPSETTGSMSNLFETIDTTWRLFRCLQGGRRSLVESQPWRVHYFPDARVAGTIAPTATAVPPRAADDALLDRVYHEINAALDVRCLVLDAEFRLMHSFGDTADILRVAPGRMTLDVFSMLAKELQLPLRSALARAAREHGAIEFNGVALARDGEIVNLRVRPVEVYADRPRLFIVVIERSHLSAPAEDAADADAVPGGAQRITLLEQDLQNARANLQATIEELQASNEELQATNEEMLAANEELQSTNEEMQAVNDELHAVNVEHQDKITQLVDLQADLEHVMRTSDVGIAFTDEALSIRRFTSAITRVLPLMPHDVGRPLAHIGALIPGVDVAGIAARVLETGTPEFIEFRRDDNSWLELRVAPYVGSGRRSGVILSVVNISQAKLGERRLQAVLDGFPEVTAVLDAFGTILEVNRAWRDFAEANGAPSGTHYVGANYLDICQHSSHDPLAIAAAQGIRAVLGGERPNFELVYPCHSPTVQRWFLLKVVPFGWSGGGCVTTHIDISRFMVGEGTR